MTLNRELTERWIADLRSGRYKQARGTLRARAEDGVGYAYCCLGVACDTAGFDWDTVYTENRYDYVTLSESKDPPQAMIEMFGLESEWAEGEGLSYTTCEQWNDTDKLSFDEIADRLEKHLANE